MAVIVIPALFAQPEAKQIDRVHIVSCRRERGCGIDPGHGRAAKAMNQHHCLAIARRVSDIDLLTRHVDKETVGINKLGERHLVRPTERYQVRQHEHAQ